MSYFPAPEQAVLCWPGQAGRELLLGGVPVTAAQAAEAIAVLSGNGSSAIASVLRAAANPLSCCDYWAVARPHLAAARAALPETHKAGTAGRHLAKHAFCHAVRSAIAALLDRELDAAFDAFRADERYAAAIAREAVAVQRRRHGAGWQPAVFTSDSDECHGTDEVYAA